MINPKQSNELSKDSPGNTNIDPLGLQNLFGGTNKNPLQSALSVDGAKIFIVTSQGLVLPLSGLKNGVTDILPNIPGLPKLSFIS